MKARQMLLVAVAVVLLLGSGCANLIEFARNAERITPSDVIITETRSVSGFTGVEMNTFGRLILTQGDSESLTVTGSDNLVPLVTATVRDGVLVLDTEPEVMILGENRDNVLTFDITVTDLTMLAVSGLAEVTMESLTTSSLALSMSGGGQIEVGQLTAESTTIDVSGLGSIEVAGESATATISLSGAGDVRAGDLACRRVSVDISGLGGATVWATDELEGDISGGGSVRYYGNPETRTSSSGLGGFEALGEK